MELQNHPIEREIHLPNLHLWIQNINFPGCIRLVEVFLTHPPLSIFVKLLEAG